MKKRVSGIISLVLALVLLVSLSAQGYRKASLTVQKTNYAVHMYEKAGFHTVDENDEEYIMVCELQETASERIVTISGTWHNTGE